MYQWIKSDVPPANYVGDGTPLSTTKFTQLADVREGGEVVTKYYFWVKNETAVYRASYKSKTLSTRAISQYIENPKSSGIPYVAVLDKNAFAFMRNEDRHELRPSTGDTANMIKPVTNSTRGTPPSHT